MRGVEPRLLDAVEETDALFFGSNMLAGKAEAALATAARERALELGRPIVFDPNMRLGRWENSAGAPARRAARACPTRFSSSATARRRA